MAKKTDSPEVTETKIKKQSQIVMIWKRLRQSPSAMIGMCIFGFMIMLAVFAPLIAPYDPNKINVMDANLAPSLLHLFGTDATGRDIFSRILYGGRYSMTLGLASTLLGTLLGMVFGSIAGYFGGTVDDVVMRITDVFQSIPGMVLNVVVACALGTGFWKCILVLSIGGITGSARMLRAQILQIRSMEYIEAAEVTNCSSAKVIVKHLIPNAFAPMIVSMSMSIGGNIMAAASLAYLGLGVQPPSPEWGAMLSAGRDYLAKYPWMCIFPGVAIMVTVLALNLFGDGLRDALDPKQKK